MQAKLFSSASPLPSGFVHSEGFLCVEEEQELFDSLRTLPFEEARYKQYTAKRRTVSYVSHCIAPTKELRYSITLRTSRHAGG
jgi:hypothetical protein